MSNFSENEDNDNRSLLDEKRKDSDTGGLGRVLTIIAVGLGLVTAAAVAAIFVTNYLGAGWPETVAYALAAVTGVFSLYSYILIMSRGWKNTILQLKNRLAEKAKQKFDLAKMARAVFFKALLLLTSPLWFFPWAIYKIVTYFIELSKNEKLKGKSFKKYLSTIYKDFNKNTTYRIYKLFGNASTTTIVVFIGFPAVAFMIWGGTDFASTIIFPAVSAFVMFATSVVFNFNEMFGKESNNNKLEGQDQEQDQEQKRLDSIEDNPGLSLKKTFEDDFKGGKNKGWNRAFKVVTITAAIGGFGMGLGFVLSVIGLPLTIWAIAAIGGAFALAVLHTSLDQKRGSAATWFKKIFALHKAVDVVDESVKNTVRADTARRQTQKAIGSAINAAGEAAFVSIAIMLFIAKAASMDFVTALPFAAPIACVLGLFAFWGTFTQTHNSMISVKEEEGHINKLAQELKQGKNYFATAGRLGVKEEIVRPAIELKDFFAGKKEASHSKKND